MLRMENNLFMKIIGLTCQNVCSSRAKNRQLHAVYEEFSIIFYIKIQRLKSLGHVVRWKGCKRIRQLYNTSHSGENATGRCRNGQRDRVLSDSK